MSIVKIHSQHFGLTDPQAPQLVLIHGWGMHSGIWLDLTEILGEHYAITVLDLPGHGRSQVLSDKVSLDVMVEAVRSVISALSSPVTMLGWSLGGIVVMAYGQRYSQDIERLYTLATNPCFVQRDDWQQAMSEDVFQQFSDNVLLNTDKTLQRFCMQQVQGSPAAKSDLKSLKTLLSDVDVETQPQAEALALLADDYRSLYTDHSFPVTHVLCELDNLVPAEVSSELKALSDAEVLLLHNASHVPMLSSAESLADVLLGRKS